MRRASLRLLLVGCVLAAGCTRDVDSRPSPSPSPPAAEAVEPSHAKPLPTNASIADVAARVTPSVVNVFSERTVARRGMSPMFSDPFRGRGAKGPSRERSLGSGVIVSSDGVILTNNHVVENADKVRVALQDGRVLDAKVVGTDPPSDIAVLRVEEKGLPAIEIADSAKTRIGDLVLAIGDPFGLGQTVTMGIISAVGRANLGITDYEDFIQTDAAINPGNSGGALVDMNGRLVGINTAIVSKTGGYAGIGFAIPSNMALEVERAILAHGKVTRGYLGVAVQEVTADLAKQLGVTAHHGVVVSDVSADSPAAKAGLRRGDVIVSIDGVQTDTPAHLRNIVGLGGKDKRVTLAVERDGKPTTIDVTLGELSAASTRGESLGGVLEGVSVQTLDQSTRQKLSVPDQIHGVVVAKVDPDSAAAELGLREGDVIVEVNRTETPDVDAFQKATRSAGGVLLLVYRDGATIYMSLTK